MSKPAPDWVGKSRMPNFDYFTIVAASASYNDLMPKLVGVTMDYKWADNDVFYNENDIKQACMLLEAKQEKIQLLLSYIYQSIDSFLTASERCGAGSTRADFEAWYNEFYKFLPALGLALPIQDVLTKLVFEFLSQDDFLKINYSEETATIEEKQSLLKCASLQGKDFEIALKEHWKKFSWLQNKLLYFQPYSIEDFRKRAISIKNPRAELAELKRRKEESLAQSQQVLSKLSPKQKKLVEQYQDILYLRTARSEAISKAASFTYPLLASIAKQLNLTREQLLLLSKEEIDQAFQGKLPTDFSKRSYNYSFVSFNGKIEVNWKPKKASVEITNLKEVNGVVAFRGVVKGKVQKVFDISDIAKFERGSILVAPYTNPNLLPAMEKAAAIVTDFGGMTSHAAIVAREFGIPCIIGVKNATKIFKDGDEVEVDAEKGVVRRIS